MRTLYELKEANHSTQLLRDSTYLSFPEQSKFIRTETELWFPETKEGNYLSFLNDYSVSVLQDEEKSVGGWWLWWGNTTNVFNVAELDA